MNNRFALILNTPLPRFRVLGLCVLCALFYGIGSPKINWVYIGPIVLTPLLVALEGQSSRQRFLTGWLCGSLIHLVCFTWVIGTVQRYSNLNLALSVLAWILFAAYSGLAFGGMAFCFGWISRMRWIPAVVSFPVCYTAMEYLFPFIFPWHMGAGLYRVPYLIQISDVFGVYGDTALIAAANVATWEIISFLRKRRSLPWLSPVLAVFLVLCTLVYGFLRIEKIDRHREQSPSFPVGLVQANVLIEERRSALLQADIWRRYQSLTADVVRKGADLIIWPESAVHFPYRPRAGAASSSAFLKRLTQSMGRPLLFGSWSYGPEGPRNTAYLLGSDGELEGTYHKVRLLAFGEYIPFSDWFPQIKGWIQGVGDFEPGETVEPLCTGDVCFGVLICYEAILDGISRSFVNKGASFLVNITNDVWFGDTNCPEQHLMLAAFRAVENRVWMVRVANTGISAFVDPAGRILDRTPLYKQADRFRRIELMSVPTVYRAWGDWFPIACSLVLALLCLLGWIRGDSTRNTRANVRTRGPDSSAAT